MRTWTGIAFVLVLAGLYGCNGDAVREEKRDADRAAMQLADVQRERDADKEQLDQLKAQNQDLQAKETAATDQNAKLMQQISDLQAQLAAKSGPAPASTEPAK